MCGYWVDGETGIKRGTTQLENFKKRYMQLMKSYVESYNKETVIKQFEGFGQEILEKHIHAEDVLVAAQKVSGDYFNLIDHKDGTMSFAVADVIGKGIPAALAMSMIKFGMDSYGHSQLPSDGLKRLNRVVEKNVNQDMFVTMFYGLYEEMNHLLYCSSAGHEPGYIFRAAEDRFEEISVKGRVLGVRQLERYKQQEIQIHLNDLIIIFTDGVTEIRDENGKFIETDYLLDFIHKYKNLHPQDIVQLLYEDLLGIQKSGKRDDLTILIIKRVN